MAKLKVGILGATGMVGQQYVSLLENHPWFEVTWLGASERSASKTYGEAVKGRWHMKDPIPESVRAIVVQSVANVPNVDFVFSALDSGPAREYEEMYAQKMPVVSNASTHRHDPDVPMLIPEINHDHINIIPIQKQNRGWDGFISLNGATYGVSSSGPAPCTWGGWAWGSTVIGWISFSGGGYSVNGTGDACRALPMSVSCSTSPNPEDVNNDVTWSAFASGGQGPYSYSWSGDVSGSGATIIRQFSSPGTKNGKPII